jgi:hypothetical protein
MHHLAIHRTGAQTIRVVLVNLVIYPKRQLDSSIIVRQGVRCTNGDAGNHTKGTLRSQLLLERSCTDLSLHSHDECGET